MSKQFLYILLLTSLIFLFFTSVNKPSVYLFEPKIIEVPTQITEVMAEDRLSLPNSIELIIPSIKLKASILPVGFDSEGRMSVPSDNKTVSWWQYGAKPGEIGNAVIAGHFKLENGEQGVFYRLNKVKIGDEIATRDVNNNYYYFVVEDIKVYEEKDFPTSEIYGNEDESKLILITCTGKYNVSNKDYSHRLVIYASKK